MSNLLKSNYVVKKEGTRVIDSNELIANKLQMLSEMEEEYEKYRQYYMYARLRASAIASAMLFSVLAYILMGGYQPMMWLAAIAAVAFVFCKPNPRKTEEDLSKKDPDSTY